MAAGPDPNDPADMSPQERLTEIASILAQGVFRVRRQGFSTPNPAPNPDPESSQNGLEVPDESRPDGQRG